jgi:hypothetical protein
MLAQAGITGMAAARWNTGRSFKSQGGYPDRHHRGGAEYAWTSGIVPPVSQGRSSAIRVHDLDDRPDDVSLQRALTSTHYLVSRS